MARSGSATTGRMKGGVRKRGTGPTATWSFYLDMGLQPAQRCRECGHRVWLTRERLDACPKSGGHLHETRERRTIEESGYRTMRDANDARAERLRLQRQGSYVAPVRLTLTEYLRDRWLPAVRGEGLKATTKASYENLVFCHLIGPDEAPFLLGMTPLQKLTLDGIRVHYGYLQQAGRADGHGGLSPASVRRVHAVLSRALNDAVEDGLIIQNPAKGASRRLPKPSPAAGSIKAWNAEQLGAFLAATSRHRLAPLWHLIAMTGMRRGEALALRWTDLDLEGGAVTITKSRSPVGSDVVESSTKTSRCRVIQIDAETVKLLRVHAERQAEELADAGSWGEEPFVFTMKDGSPLDPRSVSRQFDKLVAGAALPTISLHGLRHTHATVALQAGVHPKVVQERLGHASITQTMDVYTHAMKQQDADAAATVADLVKAKSPSKG